MEQNIINQPAMNGNETVEKINFYLAKEFEIDGNLIAPDAIMKDVLDLDSLDYIDLVVIIEDHFKFKVNPKDLHEIVTFRNLYEYVQLKIENL